LLGIDRLFFSSCSGLLDRETKKSPKYPKHKRVMPMVVKVVIKNEPFLKFETLNSG